MSASSKVTNFYHSYVVIIFALYFCGNNIRYKSQTDKSNNYFLGFFFQNPYHFHTDWLIIDGLATKINLNQIQKYFGMGLLGPKPNF
jgi:hypothetical protein